jgi:hypothetical protein
MALTRASASVIKTEEIVGTRNRIINGAMEIDQRNAGASSVPVDTYTLDRWEVREDTDGAVTIQQSTDAPSGFKNSALITTTSTDTSLTGTQRLFFRQPIEGNNVADFAWGTSAAKTINLSFWVKSSLTGVFSGALGNNGNARNYVFTYTINSANTWEYKTITIAGDTTGTWLTNTGMGVGLFFALGMGPDYSTSSTNSWITGFKIASTGSTSVIGTLNATWQITGVQLELGSVATPFERRSYGTELQLCQRYCVVYGGDDRRHIGIASMYTTTAINLTVNTPTTMRSQPTVSKVLNGSSQWLETYVGASGTNSNANIELGEGGSTNAFRLYCTGAHSGTTAGYAAWVQILAGAKLIFSAEY